MTKIDTIINKLKLQPHPEGGFYRETYRSRDTVSQECMGKHYDGGRNFSTCIYYMLTLGSFSAFHRIKQDEGWHFYDGSPVELHLLSEEGQYTNITLGRNIERDETPQFIIPGGTWFAATVKGNGLYSLVGCTVAPGFDFRDFEMADAKRLIQNYPSYKSIIEKYCR